MIRPFTAVHLCYHAISVSSLDRLGPSKNKMHPQNKMLGSDPILFSDLLDFLFFKGVVPPHSLEVEKKEDCYYCSIDVSNACMKADATLSIANLNI